MLRVLLPKCPAAAIIERALPDSDGFLPLSEDRRAWVTLNRYPVRDLGRAERASSNIFVSRSVDALRGLHRSGAFHDLDDSQNSLGWAPGTVSILPAAPLGTADQMSPTRGADAADRRTAWVYQVRRHNQHIANVAARSDCRRL